MEEEQEEVEQQEPSEAPTFLAKPSDHPSTFGRDVSERILGEIIDSFVLKRARDPPQIPLCRLMENEVIRAMGPGTKGLIARFEKSRYSVFGAPLLWVLKNQDMINNMSLKMMSWSGDRFGRR